MRYCGPMRYAMQFPAHQLGGHKKLCVIRGYALSEVCVKRESTVQRKIMVPYGKYKSSLYIILQERTGRS
jgi:hypothetical protein